jgi:hypothetical protein
VLLVQKSEETLRVLERSLCRVAFSASTVSSFNFLSFSHRPNKVLSSVRLVFTSNSTLPSFENIRFRCCLSEALIWRPGFLGIGLNTDTRDDAIEAAAVKVEIHAVENAGFGTTEIGNGKVFKTKRLSQP